MKVPCCQTVNSYLKVSPGSMGAWLRPPTPSMPLGSTIPCQCMLVEAGKLFVRRRGRVLRTQERGQGRGARQECRAADKVAACKGRLILHGFFVVVFPLATEVGLRGVSVPPTVRSSFARVIQ